MYIEAHIKTQTTRALHMAGAALGRTAGHDDAELLSSAELKSVRAGEGEDALDVDVIVVKH